MSEYLHVEKPFLDQLAALGWEVVDQGCGHVPSDPAASLRTSFRQWRLPEVFRDAVRAINLTDSGRPRLTDAQLDDLRNQLLRQPTVRAPHHLSDEGVDRIVEKKRYWIYKNLAEWRDLNVRRIIREFRNGEGFLYLGRSYKLSLVKNQTEDLMLKNGRFQLPRKIAETGDDAARSAFRNFYLGKGLIKIPQRVALFASKVGVTLKDVCIRDLNYRWASCSTDGKLVFHWKCMMAPLKIIDYIVAHELCHIHHRDHTQEFWNEIDKVMPDYLERKAWLRENGASLDV